MTIMDVQPATSIINTLISPPTTITFVPSYMDMMRFSCCVSSPLLEPKLLVATIVTTVPVQVVFVPSQRPSLFNTELNIHFEYLNCLVV